MADADLPDAAPLGAAALGGALRRQLVVRRILQFAVDLAVMALICLIPLGTMWLLLPRAPDGTVRLVFGFLAFCLSCTLCLAIAVGYWIWLPGRRRIDRLGGDGQTPAMRWFRLRVFAESGADPTRGQLALRWLMLLVDGIGFGLVGVIAMMLTPRGQRIGDLLAGTVVVSERHHRPVTPRRRSVARVPSPGKDRGRAAGHLD